MTDKKNDEKLKILRDRLAQIQEKSFNENDLTKRSDLNLDKDINSSIENSAEINSNKVNKKPIIYIILFLLIGFSTFLYFSKTKTDDKFEKKSTYVKEIVEKEIIYSLKYKGNNIAVISKFLKESSAKAEVNNLITKGFKANYIFLPEISNSLKKEYQVFIGPYETIEETNQWIKNIDKEISIINISDGTIIRTIKSSYQIKIEKEKLAKEKAEKEKLAKEKAEKEKLAKEKAEKVKKKKLAKEKAKKEKLAKEKARKLNLNKVADEKKRLLEQEAEKLKKEIALLKDRKVLIENNKDIKIEYTYKFTETKRDEGFVTISNNAGYPIIKQTFINVELQGGSSNIVKGIKKIMNTNGMLIDQIYFEKSGNITPVYKGEISEVYN